MAGMGERSAGKWQCGPLPPETKQERRLRSCSDLFDGIWEEEIEPLLQGAGAGRLRAMLNNEWLEERYSGHFSASQFGTLQPRLRALRQAQEASAQRAGAGSVFPPATSSGPRGPDRLHPLQLLGRGHRRPAPPPPAVPSATEPFALALGRGGLGRDLPGTEAGAAERLVGFRRRAAGDSFRQLHCAHPQDQTRPRPRSG